jgi:hypothetical protein
VSRSDHANLALSLEQNLAVHASWLHRGTPGMSAGREAGLLIADSGLDDDTFNYVGEAALTPQNAADRISTVLADVTRTGRSFAWRVGPASAPSDLAARLTRAGLPPAAAEPAMWLGLGDQAATGREAATDLEIRSAGTDAELRDWAWVLAANWDPPSATVLEFYRRTASLLLAPAGPARLLVGYSGGLPVCTAEVLLHRRVVQHLHAGHPAAPRLRHRDHRSGFADSAGQRRRPGRPERIRTGRIRLPAARVHGVRHAHRASAAGPPVAQLPGSPGPRVWPAVRWPGSIQGHPAVPQEWPAASPIG